jgi:hypothetical protein
MRIATATTAFGIKIKFDTASMPITSGLKNLIECKKVAKGEESLAQQVTHVKRRLPITRGKSSAHCSAKEGFSFTLQSRDKEDSKGRSKYENSRKPRGKKQKGGTTIRGMYLN